MRGLTALCIVALLVPATQPADAAGKDRMTLARAQIAKGEKQLKKREFGPAEKHFRNALATEPALPTAHLGLGAALVGQQRFEEALAALEEAERRYVAWEQQIQIADLQMRQLSERQLQAAADLAAAAQARSNPSSVTAPQQSRDSATADRIRTEQFVLRDRFEQEDFDAIPAQVFYLEGISYLRTGRRDQGIEALEICLLIDGGHGLAHYNLAVALFTRGEPAAAKEHLDAALAAGVEAHPQFVADLEGALKQGG